MVQGTYAYDLNHGEFSTNEVGICDKSVQYNRKEKKFLGKHSSPPVTVHGLNRLDFKTGPNIRVNPEIIKPTKERFTASIIAWWDTVMYAAGFNWLEIPQHISWIQTGVFDIKENREWNNPQPQNSKYIKFATPFYAPPKVLCFLRFLDIRSNKKWHIKTYASSVTSTGFTINIDTDSDMLIFTASASWLAYPPDTPGMDSGRFTAEDIRSRDEPQMANSKSVTFNKSFARTPRVFLALDEFDYSSAANLRLTASVTDISSKGFTWHLDAWWNSIMYNSGASYLAWEVPGPNDESSSSTRLGTGKSQDRIPELWRRNLTPGFVEMNLLGSILAPGPLTTANIDNLVICICSAVFICAFLYVGL